MSMEKNRLEAFSDGVLAIIITIMILELKQPVGDRLQDFINLESTLAAYAISYLFIAIYWVNHHHLFLKAKQINVKILWCNMVWLFVMSFIPFATAWVGTYPTSWAPLSVYFADMLLACITFHLMDYFIVHENGDHFAFTLRGVVSIIVNLGATVLGGFCPIGAFIAVTAVNLWWIVPNHKSCENSSNIDV